MLQNSFQVCSYGMQLRCAATPCRAASPTGPPGSHDPHDPHRSHPTTPPCTLQVDPRAGVRRGSEVLVALAQYRRRGGRVQFGVLLAAVAGAAGPAGPAGPAAAMDGAAEAGGAAEADGASTVAGGEGQMCKAQAQEQEGEVGSVEWLRRRFGAGSVLVVGDVVEACVAGA